MLVRDPSLVLELSRGKHKPNGRMCLLEAVAYVAGEPWGDNPACVSPVLAAFGRGWNDGMRSNAERASLLQYIPLLVGTRASLEVERKRAYMALEWLVRRHTAAWLRAAGLDDHATALEGLAQVDTPAALIAINAAWDATGDANGDAALGPAAGDAACAAAWAGGWPNVWPAARITSWAAAGAAIKAVGWDALQPTVLMLQAEAHQLFHAMITAQSGVK